MTAQLVKRRVQVGSATVAYVDEGDGPPVLLLHGCPFSSFVWRGVIARLAGRFRCLAPDLLGLGDTETPPGADWWLPAQADTVLGFLDALGLGQVDLVGHDHGAAVAQLIAAGAPQRIGRLVLTNAEAYDNWPSADELPFVRATQLPVLGRLLLWAWSRPALFRFALRSGKAVHDPAVLTAELLDGYVAANLADPRRRAKTRRFLAGQLDAANQRATGDAVAGLRGFDHPTLIVWGEDDPHFGPDWGRRLLADIPGAVRLELLPHTGHLLMEEHPDRLARLIADFLTTEPDRPTTPEPSTRERTDVTDRHAGSSTREQVRAHYAAAATAVGDPAGRCGDGCGAGGVVEQPGIGAGLYTDADRGHLPADAVAASLGCGNPVEVADLHPGETVLDLGCGGGIDVLLSARRVGPAGTAYGLDMTEQMLALARRNAAEAGVTNVGFLPGYLEAIPLPAESVDVVISNCVINLSADKPAVFAETYRVLRPGGRIGVSDVVAEDRLTPAQRAERGDHVGCIAGALSISEYRDGLATAGFTGIDITATHPLADGIHSAIIRATKPARTARAEPALPVEGT